jgi:putative iron-dependent peroxidase
MTDIALVQPAILAPVPPLGRFLEFDLLPGNDPRVGLKALQRSLPSAGNVIGIGEPLALLLNAKVEGLRTFPAISGPGFTFPSLQRALWLFLGSSDTGELHDLALKVRSAISPAFVVREEVLAFQYRHGHDLSGYEDGTENPKDARAFEAAIVQGQGAGLDGSTFVAAQRWIHDLAHFSTLAAEERDGIVGRRLASNDEIPDAPVSAHVKRTAQESFDPPAFMLRRSMPWGGVGEHGLYFVAYGESLDRFERVLARMAGHEDGIADGLMRFSRAVSGGYYWCPPLKGEHVDLSALGL